MCLTAVGCTALPTSGPNSRRIVEGAAASLTSDPNNIVFNYSLLDINRVVLDNVATIGPESFFKSFGNRRGPPAPIRVGVGDVVQVSIFESSAGGLFIPFRDATNGIETYGAGRYLVDAAKSHDLGVDEATGDLILDFNFATQPSCAFDPRWACPLAPPENRLDREVRAGERLP